MLELLSFEDQLRADPNNYAYMSGALLGLFDGLRSYVDAMDRLGMPLSMDEIRYYVDRAAQLQQIRNEALESQRVIC